MNHHPRPCLLVTLAVLLAAGCGPSDPAGNSDAAIPAPDADPTQIDGSATIDGSPGAADAAIADATIADAVVPADADPADADPAAPPDIVAVTPAQGSVLGGELVMVTGNNFSSDIAISFATTPAICTFQSSTLVSCTAPAAASPGLVTVAAVQTSGTDALTDSFLYWNSASAVDGCTLIAPTGVDELANQAHVWQVHVTEAGITDATTGNDPSATLRVEYGIGALGTDPSTAPGWTWLTTAPSAAYGPATPTYLVDNDQYEYDGLTLGRGQYSYSFRASVEDGLSWRFCGTGAVTSRSAIACTADSECFSDEMCLNDRCRLDCATGTDCYPWGPACAGIGIATDDVTYQLYCTTENPGGGAVGDDCSSDVECLGSQCLVDITDQCTTGCGVNDGICGASSGQICTDFSDLGLCAPSCARDADCNTAGGQLCTVNLNTLRTPDRIDVICTQPSGADAPGSDCSVTNDCSSGLCLTYDNGTLVVEVCTTPCASVADCPGAVPVCGTATSGLPDGSSQDLSVCTP